MERDAKQWIAMQRSGSVLKIGFKDFANEIILEGKAN